MEKIPIFDMHCDLLTHFALKGCIEKGPIFEKYHKENFDRGNIKYTLLNCWIDSDKISKKDRFNEIMMYSMKELYNNEYIQIVRNSSDLFSKTNKVKGILGLEGLDYLNNSIEMYTMFQLGVRLVSFTWNHDNDFAFSHKSQGKLTSEGRKLVKICNELGIVIDISHLNDESALEILQLSNKPVVASHSNVRKIMNVSRNVSDEIIDMIAKSNGVIGMNASTDFIRSEPNMQDINLLVKHIDYIKNRVGIEYIALGFDFMDFLVGTNINISDDEFLDGLGNHGQVQNLLDALKMHGYSKDDIEKIAYKNALRVFNDTLK